MKAIAGALLRDAKKKGPAMDNKGTAETVQGAATTARAAADSGLERAREYANLGSDTPGRIAETLSEFVRKEPWIAIAAAFAAGYVVARVMRRISA
jgi:ElaB/YqjD/DUF883 family membrane-anchored ribosome-binding protein